VDTAAAALAAAMNQFTGRHVQGAASAAKRRSARVAVVVELTKECRVMNNRRLIQGLIPLLYGLFVGMFIGWSVELWLPGHAAVAWRYLSLFGIAVLLLAIFLILRTGYSWPWEGPAETAPMSSKAYLRNLMPWLVVVVLLLVVLVSFQPGFR
jgi:hypothetical protein